METVMREEKKQTFIACAGKTIFLLQFGADILKLEYQSRDEMWAARRQLMQAEETHLVHSANLLDAINCAMLQANQAGFQDGASAHKRFARMEERS
jgi:hypothetical protein